MSQSEKFDKRGQVSLKNWQIHNLAVKTKNRLRNFFAAPPAHRQTPESRVACPSARRSSDSKKYELPFKCFTPLTKVEQTQTNRR
jgi:hypothetical protein